MEGFQLNSSGSGLRSVAGSCEYGDESVGLINLQNLLIICEPISFSKRTLLHGLSYVRCISIDGSKLPRNWPCQIISKYKINVIFRDYSYLLFTCWNVIKKQHLSVQESSTPGKSQNLTGIT
jgi:hypothetical protein